mmetsp:Transcript_16819/g.23228  ORF Transcript_16819/g.23228 Transcript_16819/m.23228 type:complete len:254 (+) Transcript_16819:3-764(+)
MIFQCSSSVFTLGNSTTPKPHPKINTLSRSHIPIMAKDSNQRKFETLRRCRCGADFESNLKTRLTRLSSYSRSRKVSTLAMLERVEMVSMLDSAPPTTFEPQMDNGAAVGVVASALVVILLQVRARRAANAREAREVALKKMQKLQVLMVNQAATSEEVQQIKTQIKMLENEEDDARTLADFMGVTIRIITPRPIGSSLKGMDSIKDRKHDNPPVISDSSSSLLTVLTFLLCIGLLVIGYQMATVDPIFSTLN